MNIIMAKKEINVRELSNRCITLSCGEHPTKNDVRMMSMIISHDTGFNISTQLIDSIVSRHIFNGKIK